MTLMRSRLFCVCKLFTAKTFCLATGILFAQQNVSTPLQTADSAVQIYAGYPPGLPGTTLITSVVGNNYPSWATAPVHWQPQASALWVPVVQPRHAEVVPPAASTPTLQRAAHQEDSIPWKPMMPGATLPQALFSNYSSNHPITSAIRSATGFENREDEQSSNLNGEEDLEPSSISPSSGDLSDPTTDPMATSSFEPLGQMFATSCLDLTNGCGDPSVTIIATASIAPTAPSESSLDAMMEALKPPAFGQKRASSLIGGDPGRRKQLASAIQSQKDLGRIVFPTVFYFYPDQAPGGFRSTTQQVVAAIAEFFGLSDTR